MRSQKKAKKTGALIEQQKQLQADVVAGNYTGLNASSV